MIHYFLPFLLHGAFSEAANSCALCLHSRTSLFICCVHFNFGVRAITRLVEVSSKTSLKTSWQLYFVQYFSNSSSEIRRGIPSRFNQRVSAIFLENIAPA